MQRGIYDMGKIKEIIKKIKTSKLLKIEIITENITTKPPIIIIVLLDSRMAFESISPKF